MSSFMVLPGQARRTGLSRLPAGVVVAHLVGRLAWDGADYEMIGYFSFIEGFSLPLFTGAPSEQTARLSFRTERFQLSAIPNGMAFQIRRIPAPDGSSPALKLYFNPAPLRDFNLPATFSDGELIGVLRARATQGILVPEKMFKMDGSVVAESFSPFNIDGQTLSFEKVVDMATLTFSGVPPSLLDYLSGSVHSVPFSATVFAADEPDKLHNRWGR